MLKIPGTLTLKDTKDPESLIVNENVQLHS